LFATQAVQHVSVEHVKVLCRISKQDSIRDDLKYHRYYGGRKKQAQVHGRDTSIGQMSWFFGHAMFIHTDNA